MEQAFYSHIHRHQEGYAYFKNIIKNLWCQFKQIFCLDKDIGEKVEELYRLALEINTPELINRLGEIIPGYKPWTDTKDKMRSQSLEC
ncbi:MAG: hypothetical protein A2W77_09280 [Nitrospinae bacterium RIFCSPLOWO2_12_39_16]|nr:MAG: hypothetical protein A2W77_09280 [Nitrospinae bacterium RIFCSPLOWO2_12_39_16]